MFTCDVTCLGYELANKFCTSLELLIYELDFGFKATWIDRRKVQC